MSALTVRRVERLCHDREGLRATQLAGHLLIERRWHEYQPAAWDEPAILAFADEECVGAINFNRDDKMLIVNISFAWCSPAHPRALALCLAAFRAELQRNPAELSFACHPDNAPMLRLVQLLQLQPSSLRFRVPLNRGARP